VIIDDPCKAGELSNLVGELSRKKGHELVVFSTKKIMQVTNLVQKLPWQISIWIENAPVGATFGKCFWHGSKAKYYWP
jgi:hypothetical protein